MNKPIAKAMSLQRGPLTKYMRLNFSVCELEVPRVGPRKSNKFPRIIFDTQKI